MSYGLCDLVDAFVDAVQNRIEIEALSFDSTKFPVKACVVARPEDEVHPASGRRSEHPPGVVRAEGYAHIRQHDGNTPGLLAPFGHREQEKRLIQPAECRIDVTDVSRVHLGEGLLLGIDKAGENMLMAT